MNEATPPWRSFSSETPAGADATSARPGHEPAPASRAWWLVPLLLGFGGLAAGGLAAVLLVFVLLAGSAPTADAIGEPLELGPVTAIEPRPSDEVILVDVAGAVVRPGLHRLRASGRVGDAIEAAGGFAPRVDIVAASEQLNLAQRLEDGAKVLVPELGLGRGGPSSTARDGRIDLNTASQSELESLPGIGPVTAGKIMAARAERRFETVRDLRSRGLVGESVFGDIEDRITAG